MAEKQIATVEPLPPPPSARRRPGLLTPAELADYLGVEPNFVYKRIKGERPIPHFRLAPRVIRFDVNSDRFMEWLAAHLVSNTETPSSGVRTKKEAHN